MLYRILADALVFVHLGFVVFVVVGGLLVLRWKRVALLHVPAAIWGIAIEFAGWICPLTPLENRLRSLGGQGPYQGDFIERYLLPILYPVDLTRSVQIVLAAFALLMNLWIYGLVFRSRPRV